MPLAALESGLDWDWRSTADYLDRVEGATAVNVGFLVGHSALRRAVMGADAVGGAASPEQVARDAQRCWSASLQVGGLGFSSSQNSAHTDGDARPVPSRAADRDELLALASVVADHPGTTLEFITAGCLNELSDDELELMADLSVVGRRPLNWNVLTLNPASARPRGSPAARVGSRPGPWRRGRRADDAGGRHAPAELPDVLRAQPPAGLADGARAAGPRAHREACAIRTSAGGSSSAPRRAQGPIRALAHVDHFRIGQTHAPQNAAHAGRLVGEIAREQGRDAHEVLFDIVVADELRTHLWPESVPDTAAVWEMRARSSCRDPRILLGGSDAGAHLDRMCGARYPTELLAEGVRRFGALSIEEAVRMLTDDPARLFGLRDRGRLEPGMHAGRRGVRSRQPSRRLPIHEVADLPGGCERLTSEAIGVEHVLVAGVGIVEAGELTGARPGRCCAAGATPTPCSRAPSPICRTESAQRRLARGPNAISRIRRRRRRPREARSSRRPTAFSMVSRFSAATRTAWRAMSIAFTFTPDDVVPVRSRSIDGASARRSAIAIVQSSMAASRSGTDSSAAAVAVAGSPIAASEMVGSALDDRTRSSGDASRTSASTVSASTCRTVRAARVGKVCELVPSTRVASGANAAR